MAQAARRRSRLQRQHQAQVVFRSFSQRSSERYVREPHPAQAKHSAVISETEYSSLLQNSHHRKRVKQNEQLEFSSHCKSSKYN